MPLSHRGRVTRNVVLAGVTVLAVGVGAFALRGGSHPFGSPSCQATASGTTFEYTPEQMANAATIAGIAMKRGLPARAATIALATARQESKFINVDYGDRDSLGLFQQRPSQGWGTKAQVSDPVYATNAFYDVLTKIEGYRSMEITKVAQKVQRSAYPEAYADHEPEGRVLASALSGNSKAALTCRLDPDSTSGGAAAVAPYLKALGREQVAVQSSRLTGKVPGVRLDAPGVTTAWSLAQWSVAGADRLGIERVYVDGKVWDRAKPDDGWTASSDGGDGVVVTFAP
ncbi:hypothetical protein GCM10023145_29310 [Angustibacter luteus]|uniref:Heavy metal transporter n=1 Tax=Angustibacter luteus TaxID=658456 RepID=A0ABW1JHY5_9ACTN